MNDRCRGQITVQNIFIVPNLTFAYANANPSTKTVVLFVNQTTKLMICDAQ